jgi:hypothetical protein
MVMPVTPASPKNSATSDQAHAANVPTLMSVSIVAVACLRFCQAALWNGHPAHSTTGVASCSASHCQLSNCSAGTIDSRRTGSDSIALRTSRLRSAVVWSRSAGASSPSAAGTTAS